MIPNRNDKCPCNSGLKFKRCCIDSWKYNYKLFASRIIEKRNKCKTVGGRTSLIILQNACNHHNFHKILDRSTTLKNERRDYYSSAERKSKKMYVPPTQQMLEERLKMFSEYANLGFGQMNPFEGVSLFQKLGKLL